MLWVPFIAAFASSLLIVPVVRWLSFRTGKVAQPRKDRWHTRPTPTLGGIGIFFGFTVGVLSATIINGAGFDATTWAILAGALMCFSLGLVDDFLRISPPSKLIGQILAAALVIFAGFQINFFKFELLNILLTFVWLVGITNAINLLDNMDGLAGGIALIVAAFLSFFFMQSDVQPHFLAIALSVAGGVLGFLIFNFPPAKIFMGDSGSLFLGFTLAALAVARRTSASNVFAVLGIPTLLFLIPILDTTLVTITRLLRGQSPAQGGRDHTSHRLIAFGLTERQTALVLYGTALISGIASTAVESLAYDFSLVFVPVLILALSLVAAYLGRLKVVPSGDNTAPQHGLTRVVVELTYRQRLFEVILDFVIISIAYYLALWTGKFDLSLSQGELDIFIRTLPIALMGAYIAYFFIGVYRAVWEYIGTQDLVGYVIASIAASLLSAIGIYLLFPADQPSIFTHVLFAIFLLLGLASSRSSFKILDQIYTAQPRPGEARVILYGASNDGELTVRWLLANPQLGYRPIGFIDDDPFKWGRVIHGVRVMGGLESFAGILATQNVDGLIITSPAVSRNDKAMQAIHACQERGLWVRRLRMEFESVE